MRAGGRRPAREPSAPRASLGASPRSPARPRHRPPAPRQVPPAPTGTAAGPSGALRTSGARSLMCGSACRLEARPGPAAAHRHCGRSLWRPSAPSALASLALRRVARCGVSKPGQAPLPPSNFACNSSDVFHGLKCDRWNSADSALVWGRAELELHAELGEFPVSLVELVAQGCTTWVGIALPSCRCNAVLSGALVLYLVHRFAVVKLVTPFRPCVSAGLKPASPLLA